MKNLNKILMVVSLVVVASLTIACNSGTNPVSLVGTDSESFTSVGVEVPMTICAEFFSAPDTLTISRCGRYDALGFVDIKNAYLISYEDTSSDSILTDTLTFSPDTLGHVSSYLNGYNYIPSFAYHVYTLVEYDDDLNPVYIVRFNKESPTINLEEVTLTRLSI